MASPQRNQREVIEFLPNVPVTLALKYAQGKIVSGIHGERVMFTTLDNRVAFLDPAVAGQIEAAGINVREAFTITQEWDGAKNSPRTWKVARLIGEQHNGTMVVPALPERPEAKPAQRAASATSPPEERRDAISAHLVAESILAVDAYAVVLKHALDTHGGRVKPDEVKSIFLTTLISCSGKGRAA